MKEFFRKLDHKTENLRRKGVGVAEETMAICRYLGEGDAIVTLCSCSYPPEMTMSGWVELGEVIRDSVKKGATYIYLTPSQEAVENAKRLGMFSLKCPADLHFLFEQFSNRLGPHKDIVAKQVHLVEYPQGFFQVPEHLFRLVKPFSGRNLEPRVICQTSSLISLNFPQTVVNEFFAYMVTVLQKASRDDLVKLLFR